MITHAPAATKGRRDDNHKHPRYVDALPLKRATVEDAVDYPREVRCGTDGRRPLTALSCHEWDPLETLHMWMQVVDSAAADFGGWDRGGLEAL